MWLSDRQHPDQGASVVDRLDLLKVTFPHSDLVVAIGSNQHGVGSSRAEGERLRDRSDAQGAPLARKRSRLRLLSRLLMATLVAAWGVVLLVI
ncbi:MAG: hypothetical protein DMD87_10970 [Candidatus Rokuibacteriota bacterium]|nr:MAG: hypothetical protein DMD87_10970 [Candidatus Rokubacteria bacterium]